MDCTKEVRLRLLQWKIIHNIYPTKILLHKMKIEESPKCITCNEIDYSEHFFYECRQVKPVWNEIEKIIMVKIGKRINLKMRDVMLGIVGLEGVSKSILIEINHIILVGKLVISKFKYGNKKFSINLIKQELRFRKL